tara:strand:- start:139 stop:336 length:198 start_codon:yes stop_codon:yes gene_type:complete
MIINGKMFIKKEYKNAKNLPKNNFNDPNNVNNDLKNILIENDKPINSKDIHSSSIIKKHIAITMI